MSQLQIQRVLKAQATSDVIVHEITDLINEVYKVAEKGLWTEGSCRTTKAEVSRLIAAEEILAAYLGENLVGCVRIQQLSAKETELGMLAVKLAQRGTGVGRNLVKHVEDESKAKGFQAVQLEILVPKEWVHPSKAFLEGWYTRIGYEKIRSGTIDESYPELAPLLATTCDFVIYQKKL